MRMQPPEHIAASPDGDNLLVWFYVLEGPPNTPYEGGMYLGRLRFPPDYPLAAPSIFMCTPNGRFRTEERLCLSMSDFHPKEWNPLWTCASILTGLLSFMLEEHQTHGSIETSDECKRRYAAESLSFNLKHPAFIQLFPQKVEEAKRRLALTQAAVRAVSPCRTSSPKAARTLSSRLQSGAVMLQFIVQGTIGVLLFALIAYAVFA